jgi:hypothetical protein
VRTAFGRACLTFCFAIICAGFLHADEVASGAAAEHRLLDLLNGARTQQKLPALLLDEHLVEAARRHSQAMAKGNRLAHQMPGEAGLNPRVAAAGARFDAVAENVAHSGSVEDAHDEFMRSAGHRANILNREYDAVGIGIAAADNGHLYVTEDFIHRVTALTPEAVEAKVFEAANRIRSDRHLLPLQLTPLPMLRHEACRNEVNAHSIAESLSLARWVVVFTGGDPADLPGDMRKVTQNREAASLALGACFPSEVPGNYAMFKVIAVFFRKPF